jgi:hypothetical protein
MFILIAVVRLILSLSLSLSRYISLPLPLTFFILFLSMRQWDLGRGPASLILQSVRFETKQIISFLFNFEKKLQSFLKLRKSSVLNIDSLEKFVTIIEVLKLLFIWQSAIISMEQQAFKMETLLKG